MLALNLPHTGAMSSDMKEVVETDICKRETILSVLEMKDVDKMYAGSSRDSTSTDCWQCYCCSVHYGKCECPDGKTTKSEQGHIRSILGVD